MPHQPPKKFDASTIDRCADIASIQRRDIFDPRLTKLMASACRWDERQRVVSERARIVRAGRVFTKAIAKASPLARKPLDVLPYGATAWLTVTLDGMAPASPRARLSKWNSKFVILLCALVDEAGGKLTLGDGTTRSQGSLVQLLAELKPYLPRGFVPTSLNTLRRLKKSAAGLSTHVR
jgi:hypothetical protein